MSSHIPTSVTQADRKYVLGVLLMVLAMIIIPFLDAIAKELSTRYSVLQITWARYFFHFALMLPLALATYGRQALVVKSTGMQILRGGFLMASTFLYFSALALIPLADALALVFIYPFVVTVLSVVILKEPVGIRRWMAVLVGLLGALIIVRPGFSDFGIGTMLALAAGITYGCYLISTRKLANTAPPMVTLTFTALIGVVVLSILVPYGWQTPTTADWLWMILLGTIAALGHYLIIRAFEFVEASILAPYGYTEILMACLLGYVVFGDLPDILTWIGIATIIISGIYISVRERHKQP